MIGFVILKFTTFAAAGGIVAFASDIAAAFFFTYVTKGCMTDVKVRAGIIARAARDFLV
jgi:hypothetical protein